MNPIGRIVERLRRKSLWSILWISLILSEILTAVMNTAMGYLWWGHFSLDLVLIGTVDAFFVAGIVTVFVILLFREYDRLEKEAEEGRRQIAALQEREEVSRWLHDELGSDLFNVSLITEMLQQRQVEGPEAAGYLDMISDATRNALNNIRSFLNFSGQVGPSVRDLVVYMRDYGEVLFSKKEIAFDFRAETVEESLPLLPMKSFSVYLIYKEAITNILKHSGARSVSVRLVEEGGRLSLTISDDGLGFTVDEKAAGHYGTKNMTRRAKMIGGEASFDSGPGRGTRVRLTVPV